MLREEGFYQLGDPYLPQPSTPGNPNEIFFAVNMSNLHICFSQNLRNNPLG